MGVDFNAAFRELNTNNAGNSANILDAAEVAAGEGSIWTLSVGMNAEAFKEANQHCTSYDTDKDGIVTVKEQKAEIKDQLKNVWTSCIARFFKEDLPYDDSSASVAAQITSQVQVRIKNALEYIQYAKDNKIDIFYDNEGTGVDDKDGELQEYTDSTGRKTTTTAKPGIDRSVKNNDGTYTYIHKDGHTATVDENYLIHSSTYTDGTKYDYKYNEDGSYSYTKTFKDGSSWHMPMDKNNHNLNIDSNGNIKSGYKITAKGNYKAFALAGETVDQTLNRLGITGKAADIVKQANPKASKSGAFRTDCPDVYIPKQAILLMQKDGTFDENALMGVGAKIGMGV